MVVQQLMQFGTVKGSKYAADIEQKERNKSSPEHSNEPNGSSSKRTGRSATRSRVGLSQSLQEGVRGSSFDAHPRSCRSLSRTPSKRRGDSNPRSGSKHQHRGKVWDIPAYPDGSAVKGSLLPDDSMSSESLGDGFASEFDALDCTPTGSSAFMLVASESMNSISGPSSEKGPKKPETSPKNYVYMFQNLEVRERVLKADLVTANQLDQLLKAGFRITYRGSSQ